MRLNFNFFGASSDTHQLLAVLLSCAGTEQLHVEEGEDSQQLRLQVVGLEHDEKDRNRHKQSVRQEIPKFIFVVYFTSYDCAPCVQVS